MTVFFIGAGPGDPELITVRGLRLIDQCFKAIRIVNGDLRQHLAIYVDVCLLQAIH